MQVVLPLNDQRVLGFERISPDGTERIMILANVSEQDILVPLPVGTGERRDLLSGKRTTGSSYPLDPYEIAWLA